MHRSNRINPSECASRATRRLHPRVLPAESLSATPNSHFLEPRFQGVSREASMLDAMKTAISQNRRLLSVCLFSLVVTVRPCFGEGDPWQSLRLLKRGLGFVFIQHDQTCRYGELKEVTDTNVSIKTSQGIVVIPKADLVRIRSGFGGRSVANDNPNLPLFTLYSGRSSWADVFSFRPL
jgi:hypothetical protein